MRFRSYFNKKEIILIGCGRSGTGFSTNQFNRIGLNIGHEFVAKNGMASWMSTVHSKKNLWKGYKLVLHQVRNPLDSISSIQTFNTNSWDFVSRNLSQINMSEQTALRCIKYWYYWNLLAERKTNLRFRVENIEDIIPFVCFFFNIEYSTKCRILNSKINSRIGHYKKLSWEDIKNISPEYYSKCRILSEKYGYKS